MPCATYRLYLGDQPATLAQLNRFEDITVHQQMDVSWTADMEVPICVDSNGNWSGETDPFLVLMARVRIEVKMQNSDYVPLIDGPITSLTNNLSGDPGQSTLKVTVQDDGFLLHQDEQVHMYPGIADDQIAQQVFDDVTDIATTDIDSVRSPANLSDNTTVMRGTAMELLQKLAGRQQMHAFVLPGPSPHTSVGCFKTDSSADSGLPDMVLLGPNRNLLSIHFDPTAASQAVFRTSTVALEDRSTQSTTADSSDVNRLGADPPAGPSNQRLLRPGESWSVDQQSAVQGATNQAAYSLSGNGEVLPDTYMAVLRPYLNINILGANGTLSGRWTLSQVTHYLTRNSYRQTFSVKRNAVSGGTGNDQSLTPPTVM